MHPTKPLFAAYAAGHTTAAPSLLAQVHEDTHARVPGPQMLSGHLQGRLLAAFAHMLRPGRVLELGTYVGYSALCLAEGLAPGGVVHTIDHTPALAAIAQGYFAQAGLAHKIKQHVGQAVDIIPQLGGGFDLVFMDADKRNYRRYYDLVLARVRPGGFIIADNVLWGGKVLPTAGAADARTEAMRAFNAYVHHDPRVENVLLPVRDGLMLLRKR